MYSKKKHCCSCGVLVPTADSELLSVGKTVERLCMSCYKVKARAAPTVEVGRVSLQEVVKEKAKK